MQIAPAYQYGFLTRKDDGLNAVRGIFNAALICLVFWIFTVLMIIGWLGG